MTIWRPSTAHVTGERRQNGGGGYRGSSSRLQEFMQ
jgi:hypothetical protein